MEDLIIRILNGRATPEEEDQLVQWRRRSPENERAYRALAKLWAVTGAADPIAGRSADLPDADLLIRRAEAEPEREPELAVDPLDARRKIVVGPTSSMRRRARWLPRLATAAVLLGVGFGLGMLFDETDAPPGLLADGQITTGSGEMATLTLAGGTSIRVGPQSRIRVVQEDAGPVAELHGRAFFAVRTDSARTFTVRTARGQAMVLGTRFEVRAEEDEFRVLVVDGSVRVQAGGESVELQEAEMGRAHPDAPLFVDRIDDAYAHLDWMGKALVFQATSLDRALREIERRYAVSVILMDSTLADLEVTATFTGEPVDQVILVLCEISGARCSMDGDVVRVGRGTSISRSQASTGSA